MEETVDLAEAITILKVSRASLYNLMKAGRLTPVKQRSGLKRPRPRFRRTDLDRLMDEREQERAEEERSILVV